MTSQEVDIARHRFPYCIVWTPLPLLTWMFPLIGHMGIATSKGVIRDFAGSYFVAEDDMGFGWPTMYWKLTPELVDGGAEMYDRAIREASDEYKGRMHNLCCDNCHSHVALALNNMQYGGHDRWNMVKLALYMQINGKFTGVGGFLKQWGFFFFMCCIMVRLTVELIDNAPQFINTVRERELNLRGYKIPVIENMGVTRDQFDVLDLTDNDVKRLDNLPLLKRLHTLYLHNNRVHYIQPDIGEKLPNLKILALTNNNITELGDIDPLANCKNLEYVTFIGNPITHKTNYRNYIIYKLPSVRVIDFKREREAARKMFKGKKGQKAREAIKRSTNAPADVENGDVPRISGSALTPEDRVKIQNAIASARSLAEVEYLQSVLASGRIPEKGWNRQMLLPTDEAPMAHDGGFVPETEDQDHNAAHDPASAMEVDPHGQNGNNSSQERSSLQNGKGNGQSAAEGSGMEVGDDSRSSHA
ncbi:leucine Rich repeat-containing domain protein [Oesophagostomum dentatum]|uniref:Probable U2 small nuclear ribonucleoprotein A' n=1 Tax=Oesophagostomum dentatum TaxID=61180 RepID=A0A0B1T186_OESDE|nr:leucine Rich repeat-containing domain protein [Oesophagostomum dentatum]